MLFAARVVFLIVVKIHQLIVDMRFLTILSNSI